MIPDMLAKDRIEYGYSGAFHHHLSWNQNRAGEFIKRSKLQSNIAIVTASKISPQMPKAQVLYDFEHGNASIVVNPEKFMEASFDRAKGYYGLEKFYLKAGSEFDLIIRDSLQKVLVLEKTFPLRQAMMTCIPIAGVAIGSYLVADGWSNLALSYAPINKSQAGIRDVGWLLIGGIESVIGLFLATGSGLLSGYQIIEHSHSQQSQGNFQDQLWKRGLVRSLVDLRAGKKDLRSNRERFISLTNSNPDLIGAN